MKINLLTRFLVIIGITLIAGWIAWTVPPRLGTDLAGGTSLLYELDMSKVPADEGGDLAARVIQILKERVDPLGQKNIVWRVVEGKRIQIQMPYPSKEVQAARKNREQAEKNLKEIMWKQAEIEGTAKNATQAATPDQRKAILEAFIAERIAPSTDPAAKAQIEQAKTQALDLMNVLADAWQRLNKAQAKLVGVEATQWPAQDIAEREEARTLYSAALQKVLAQSVDLNLLTNLMKAADARDNLEAQQELAAIPDRFPMQNERIRALMAAHTRELKLNAGGVDSPEELQRLVTRAGVLDFRIAVTPTELAAEREDALQSLKQRGPEQQVRANGTLARWFEIDPKAQDNFKPGVKDPVTGKITRDWSSYYVIATWASQPYILCYDDHDHTLTHSDPKRRPWGVSANRPYNDPNAGGIVLPFKLDATGANYMGDLTGNNKNRPMTILLDDRAMSAPNIMSQITESGQITFGTPSPSHPFDAIVKEAEQLKQIMDAGSLPATLQSEPISVENISPDMGADNISAGINSSFIAVLAVMLFMLVYYTVTGSFADIALLLNLVLVLAIMAIVRGTFTLPGIAGLVLTLGMAVDANVLINERIREESHRGASLWMAVKLGYERVFWTIFDSNLTTALTSVVLIFVGSEEVKGFGVTLLIGLAIQFFTALYVTRTFMMAAVKWGFIREINDHSIGEYLKEIFTLTGLRKGRWPFMRVVTISNVDWISKRHYFWAFSAIITLAGLVAFIARGEDKYDIEFRGGTQVTFQLKNPLADVETSLLALAADSDVVKSHPQLKNLQQKLKESSTLATREQLVKDLAASLAADPQLVQTRPEVKDFSQRIQDDLAAHKDLSLDEVREKITSLHTTPGLAELNNARVYSVGAVSDRRYQMQTTIANEPQTFETTLPEPLTAALKGSLKNLLIRHDLSATRATFILLPLNERYQTEDELRQIIQGMAALPGMADLAAAHVTSVGKSEDHRIELTIPNRGIRVTLLQPLAKQFGDYLETKPKITFKNVNVEIQEAVEARRIILPVNAPTLQDVFAKSDYPDMPLRSVTAFQGGAAIVLDDIQPDINAEKLEQRIGNIRRSSEFSGVPSREFAVWPILVKGPDGKPTPALSEADLRPLVRAVLLTVDPSHRYEEDNDNLKAQWRNKIATTEWKILVRAASVEDLFEGVTSFDAVVASQAKFQALLAIVVSLILIVIYVWVRFGGIRFGIGAIVALIHDATMAVAATVLSGWVYEHLFHRNNYLLITDFKINLTMVAAYLTVIGYSVNDTIVIFDRVRELRGKSQNPLTPKIINDAINQCFGRTIWTSFTVLTVLFIMYIWGGEGIRGFAFAMLVGCITGVYSTLAIASPMLLTTGTADAAPSGPSPFTRKSSEKRVRELPQPEESDEPDEPEGDEPQTAR